MLEKSWFYRLIKMKISKILCIWKFYEVVKIVFIVFLYDDVFIYLYDIKFCSICFFDCLKNLFFF